MFKNRFDAGGKLGNKLRHYAQSNPMVIALPRGGVPVGYEIARELQAPLTVLVSRKLGSPKNPEYGIGAVSEEEICILDMKTIHALAITDESLQSIVAAETKELKRRVILYRNGKPLSGIHNRFVIVVDDGLATGVTAFAAVETIQNHHPKQLLYAAPVCAYDTSQTLLSQVDGIICLERPAALDSVSSYYQDFSQVTDEEVLSLLAKQEEARKWGIQHMG